MGNVKYKTEEERKQAEYLRKKIWAEKNKEKVKQSKINYIIKNKEKVKLINKKYRDNNKDKEKIRHTKYLNENVEKRLETTKKYREKNKELINKKARENKHKRNIYHKKRYNQDEVYKISCNVRCLIKKAFKLKNVKKDTLTEKLLGCTFEEFKTYLESKFEPWMNWGNYGQYNGEFNYGWDIDHIIPISSAKSEEDVIRLNHYSNLQPLCSKTNRDVKKDNLIHR